jgi:hypothetical protein
MNFKEYLIQVGLNESKNAFEKDKQLKNLYKKIVKDKVDFDEDNQIKIFFDYDSGYYQYDIDCESLEDLVVELNNIQKKGTLKNVYGFDVDGDEVDGITVKLKNVTITDYDTSYQ